MKARLVEAALGVVLCGAVAQTASCTGSETNWLEPTQPTRPPVDPPPSEDGFLADCYSDQDCARGSCLCGTCTVSCASAADCVAQGMTRCSLGDSAAYAAQCGAPGDPARGVCLSQCEPIEGVGGGVAQGSCANGASCIDGVCAHPQSYQGPLVRAPTPPPPISGGTLAIINGGRAAALADPDHDLVHIVSLLSSTVTATATLTPGDEPGRLLQDTRGFVHVVLRRAGAVASIDPQTGVVRERRPVCQYPRGLGYEPGKDVLYVACAGGELITLPARSGPPIRVLKLDDDLRDVVVGQDRLLVSRFRSAELLVVDDDGVVVARSRPPGTDREPKSPAVAWRLVPAPNGAVLMSHQLEQRPDVPDPLTAVGVDAGGYGIPDGQICSPIVVSAVTKFDQDGRVLWSHPNLPGALPVDIAAHPGGGATVAPAGRMALARVVSFGPSDVVAPRPADPAALPESCMDRTTATEQPGQVVGVAYASGALVTQIREPAQLVVDGRAILLDVPSSQDTGHELFHTEMRSGIACASCHPEGTEDGHVWRFADVGKRRTQSLGGRILATAPFHWNGDMPSFGKLVHEVMTLRMSGFRLSEPQTELMAAWIDTIPAWQPRELLDSEAVARGRVLFNDEQVACASCHVGEAMTNNESVNVGTLGVFQVPSLRGVSRRAPFMHDGCAATLLDRFSACGGGDAHGVTSQLAPHDLLDLTQYLQSL